jgi:peptidoglycan/xylan/chitin deacetylase (PgdA/CDA1 family)
MMTLALSRAAIRALSPPGARARLSIFIYHRVLAERDPLFPEQVDAAEFARQMEWINYLFNVMPLDDAVGRLERNALPARAACVTFDDGYADNAEVALPLLRKHGIPATFFVSSSFIDGGRMWNDTIIESVRRAAGDALDLVALSMKRFPLTSTMQRRAAIDALLAALKYLPQSQRDERVEVVRGIASATLPSDLMLDRRRLRDLHNAGMTIGAHTVSHPILMRLDGDTARREMGEGREVLEAIIGGPVTLFAYPNGKPREDYSAEHVRMARSLGFRGAVSTAWGAADGASDRYQLPRFTPWDRTAAKFALRLIRNFSARIECTTE